MGELQRMAVVLDEDVLEGLSGLSFQQRCAAVNACMRIVLSWRDDPDGPSISRHEFLSTVEAAVSEFEGFE